MKKNYQKPTINKVIKLKRIHLLVGSCTEDQQTIPTCTTEYSCPGDTL